MLPFTDLHDFNLRLVFRFTYWLTSLRSTIGGFTINSKSNQLAISRAMNELTIKNLL